MSNSSRLLAIFLRPLRSTTTNATPRFPVAPATFSHSTHTPTSLPPGQVYFFVKHWQPLPPTASSTSSTATNTRTTESTTTADNTPTTDNNTTTSLLQRWRDRLDAGVEKASLKWEALNQEGQAKWKRQLYITGNRLMDRIDADEWFLKSIHHPTKELEILAPEQVPAETIVHRLRTLASERYPLHQRQLRWSIMLVPVSAMASLLPGPNVFLAYNLFRVYSHDRAMRGAKYLLDVLSVNEKVTDNADGTDKLKGGAHGGIDGTVGGNDRRRVHVRTDPQLTEFYQHVEDLARKEAAMLLDHSSATKDSSNSGTTDSSSTTDTAFVKRDLAEEVEYHRLQDHFHLPDYFPHEMRRAQQQLSHRWAKSAQQQ